MWEDIFTTVGAAIPSFRATSMGVSPSVSYRAQRMWFCPPRPPYCFMISSHAVRESFATRTKSSQKSGVATSVSSYPPAALTLKSIPCISRLMISRASVRSEPILVTGATGKVGSHLVPRLLAQGSSGQGPRPPGTQRPEASRSRSGGRGGGLAPGRVPGLGPERGGDRGSPRRFLPRRYPRAGS